MDFSFSPEQEQIRAEVLKLCARFGDDYWLKKDEAGGFPTEFHAAVAAGGWLGVAMPEAYGGAGLGITEAALILEEINHSPGNGLACHAQMYTMGTLLRHGS
ncbi:MAG TPA: acyl-CoA dehydrogenase family protein, partial [Alphaproteobacteria bacterium]